MSLRTKGDLYGVTIRREKTYGVFDSTGTSVYGGTADSVSNDDMVEYQDNPSETGLMPESITYTSHQYGFTLNARMNQDTLDEWLKLTLGDRRDFTADMTSFSARFNVSPSESKMYFGCKVTNLTIKADGLGRLLMITAKVFARYATYNEDTGPNSFQNDLGDIVTFAPVDKPEGPPITYWCEPAILKESGKEELLHVKSWTLNLDRGLTREPGMIGGVSYSKVSASGIDSVPQPAKSTLSLVQAQTSTAWDKIKLIGQETDASRGSAGDIILTLGPHNQVLNITRYHIEGGLTTNTQNTYDETLTFVIMDVM